MPISFPPSFDPIRRSDLTRSPSPPLPESGCSETPTPAAAAGDAFGLERTGEAQPVRRPPLRPLEALSRALDLHSGVGAVPGNRVELVLGGAQIWQRRQEAVEQSAHELRLTTYEWGHEGQRPQDFARALVRSAERGVHVEALLDAGGAKHVPRLRRWNPSVELLETVARAPVVFSPIRRLSDIYDFHRSHGKVMVQDGVKAEVSSANVVDAALGAGPVELQQLESSLWMQGPAVQQLSDHLDALQALNAVHHGATFAATPAPRPPVALPTFHDGVPVRVVAHEGGRDRWIQASYLALDGAARESLHAHVLYPVTDDQLQSWIAAAQRGVRVRIFSGRPYEMVQRITRSQLQEALRHGVEVFLFEGRVHDKGRTWDSAVLSVSSCNGDNVSADRNHEIAVFVEDPETAQGYERQAFIPDASGCVRGVPVTQVSGDISASRWQRWGDGLVGWWFPHPWR